MDGRDVRATASGCIPGKSDDSATFVTYDLSHVEQLYFSSRMQVAPG